MNPKVKRTALILGNIMLMTIGTIMLIGFCYIFFKVIPHPSTDFVPGDYTQTHVVSPTLSSDEFAQKFGDKIIAKD
ncbi:hypothetical protein [uncultured Brevibacillus sp.]|uniref:hypothetical protein n=1 Tax=uncultured Brevibacillus sp. TaxID=169970 RepID=UPI0025932718|nr:hypothetical protein [uncultured Brevibacillus sp.]